MRRVTALLSLLMIAVLVVPAWAQEKPRSGGELVFPVPSEPPSLRRTSRGDLRPDTPLRALLQHAPPGGSQRSLRHQTGAKPGRELDGCQRRPDLHVQAPPRREVPRRQRDDLQGREGLLRQDHLPAGRHGFEPQGAVPERRGGGAGSHTVRFRLKYPQGSFLLSVASPWNFIYKADILAKDINWYEKNIMGTGPSPSSSTSRARTWWARRTPTTGTRANPIWTASGPSSCVTRPPRCR